MKRAVFLITATPFLQCLAAMTHSPTPIVVPAPAPAPQFTSTVQIAIQDPNRQQQLRSERLVLEQFSRGFDNWAALKGRRYQVRTAGNQIVFTLVSDTDIRTPMEEMVLSAVQLLNGRVHLKGRTTFLRTSLNGNQTGPYLRVKRDSTGQKIAFIQARWATPNDIIELMQSLIGPFSYHIRSECADKPVHLRFGDDSPNAPGKSVEQVMRILAAELGLEYDYTMDTHILRGTCMEQQPFHNDSPADMITDTLMPEPAPMPFTSVVFPLPPIGQGN